MSNETPQADGEPTESVPEAPAPAADAPQAPAAETPTVESQPFTYDDAVKSAGDEDDVAEAPSDSSTAPAGAAAPPGAPAAGPAADRPSGIFIPKWVGLVAAAIVAALVFGGIGYAIGDSSGDSNSRNATAFPGAANGDGQRQLPGGGNGPLGNGQGQLPGNGNGQRQLPGNGSGGGQTSNNTAFLGVALENADNGAGITDVQSGSPAADAGLKSGDVITAVDGTNVANAAAVATAIRQHSSGDQITVAYTRDGKSATAKVTLGSRASAQSS